MSEIDSHEFRLLVIISNMIINDAPVLKWILIASALVLSFLVVRWSLPLSQLPKYRNLLYLRKKLLEDIEGEH